MAALIERFCGCLLQCRYVLKHWKKISEIPDIWWNVFENMDLDLVCHVLGVTSVDGHDYILQSTVVSILSLFALDPRFIVHQQIIQTLPAIGWIITDFKGDPHSELCARSISEVYDILLCVSDHPTGLDFLIRSNVVNQLCRAAGSFTYGSSKAETLLIRIARKRGLETWGEGNMEGLHCVLLSYIRKTEATDDDSKWLYVETINAILSTTNIYQLRSDYDDDLSGLLQNLSTRLFHSRFPKEHRDTVLRFACELVILCGGGNTLSEDHKYVMKLVHFASVHIQTRLKKLRVQDMNKCDLTVCCLRYLSNILWSIYNDFDDDIPDSEVESIYKAISGAAGETNSFLQLVEEWENNVTQEEKRRSENNPVEHVVRHPHNGTKNENENEGSNTTGIKASDGMNYGRKERGNDMKGTDIKMEFSGLKIPSWNDQKYEVQNDHCEEPYLQTLMITPYTKASMSLLVTWISRSGKIPTEEMETFCHILKITRHIFRHVQGTPFLPELDDILWELLIPLQAKMEPAIHAILVREDFPALLHEYFRIKWIEYDKTRKVIEHATRHEAIPAETTYCTDEKGQQTDKETAEPCRGLGKSKWEFRETQTLLCHILRVQICIFEEEIPDFQTYEVYPRMCTFAITNLPYLETDNDHFDLALDLMNMGLLLIPLLSSVNNGPEECIVQPFFEACLNLLIAMYELSEAGKGVPRRIKRTSRFEAYCVSSGNVDIWSSSMQALSLCIPIFPSLSALILEVEWITDILYMLKKIKCDDATTEQISCFHLFLSTCAMYNTDCKKIMRQSNGLNIARKFGFTELEAILTQKL